MWVNPAQSPSVSRCAPHSLSRSPVSLIVLYKILLVQVGTLSSSHPSFGLSVLFISFFIPGEGGGVPTSLSPLVAPGTFCRSLAAGSFFLSFPGRA